jgi:hypothetical protein
MSESSKYSSYFDDEDDENNHGGDKQENKKYDSSANNNYKAPISKVSNRNDNKIYTEKIKFEFNKPEPLDMHKKILKDVHDRKENKYSLEELSSFPFSGNNDFPVEKFSSLEELYQQYGDENDMEYEVVPMQDLKDLMGDKLNPLLGNSYESYITSLEEEYSKDPENYEILNKLIFIYRETKNKEKLKQMREHTLSLFPLFEDMWKNWIDDDLADIPADDFDRKYQMITTHYLRALQDFQCII